MKIRGYWLWELLFAVSYLVAVAMPLVDGEPPARRLGSAVLLTLLLAWYLGLGRRTVLGDDEGMRAWLFVAGLAGLFCLAVWLAATNGYLLLALCPMVFLALPFWPAVLVVVLLNLAPPAIFWAQGAPPDQLRMAVPLSLLGVAFSLLVAGFVEQVTRRSRQLAVMVAELEASRAEVGRLSHAAGVATERARLAGEIHDTLAQGLTSIVTLLQAAEPAVGRDEGQVRRRLGLAVRTARENLAEARALVRASGPEALEVGSLDDAVCRLVERTGEQLGVPADFRRTGTGLPLPTGVEVVLLRAAQEALSNVCKHAKASEVTVRLSYDEASVGLAVRDDGAGFVQDGEPTGFGLPGMRRRVEQAGGSVRIATAPGAGTEVRIEVPL